MRRAIWILCACSTTTHRSPGAPPPQVASTSAPVIVVSSSQAPQQSCGGAIPYAPVAGPFSIGSIYLQPSVKGWQLALTSAKLDGPASLPDPGPALFLELDGAPPAAGARYEGKTGDAGAYVVELTAWDVHPWVATGSPFQIAGKASGKVSACVGGGAVAGKFEDVMVRYMGKP
jgi:hypothetical protein